MNNQKTKEKLIKKVIKKLKIEYPNSKCSLIYKSPYQLLVATILSSQCTDERVNKVTEKLFKQYPDAKAISKLSAKQIGKLVYSTGFYNNKAKNIKNMSDIIFKKFKEEIPADLNTLIALPGVGRKTANVVLGTYFNIPSLVVDTHVTRITNLLGLVKTHNPVIIEKKLSRIVDKNDWTKLAHLFIDHGRKVCIANRPQCKDCVISNLCISSKK